MKTAMNAATTAVRPILLLLLLALSGCFSLSRSARVQQHYVLGAGRQTEGAALEDRSGGEAAVVGLRPPRLADYLASPFMVVRQGPHRVEFSEVDRWGEDLARGVSRTLALRMAARLPAHRVVSAPWPSGVRPEYVIQLRLLRFEGVAPDDPLDAAGEAHLLATWEILGSSDGAVLGSGTTEVRSGGWTVGDFDGLVSLLDAGLDTLAEELAQRLERVSASADTPGLP